MRSSGSSVALQLRASIPSWTQLFNAPLFPRSCPLLLSSDGSEVVVVVVVGAAAGAVRQDFFSAAVPLLPTASFRSDIPAIDLRDESCKNSIPSVSACLWLWKNQLLLLVTNQLLNVSGLQGSCQLKGGGSSFLSWKERG